MLQMKSCSKCKNVLPVSEFTRRGGRDSYRSHCKACCNNGTRKHYYSHKDERRHIDYVRRYGITLDQYNELLTECQGVCTICRNPTSKALCVDHCHTTGTVRGLLCDLCNRGLGYFKDSPDSLRRAVEYLENGVENGRNSEGNKS